MTHIFSKRIKMPIIIFIVILFVLIKLLFVYYSQLQLVLPDIIKTNSLITNVLASHSLSAPIFLNMDLFINSVLAKSILYLILTLGGIAYFFNYIKLLTNNLSTAMIAVFILAINSISFIATSINLPSLVGFIAITMTLYNLEISKKSKLSFPEFLANFLVYLLAFLADYNLVIIITSIIIIQSVDLKKDFTILMIALTVFLGYFAISYETIISQFSLFFSSMNLGVFLLNLKMALSSYMILLFILVSALSKSDSIGIPKTKLYATSGMIFLIFVFAMFQPNRFIVYSLLNYTTLLIIPYISILLSNIMVQDIKNRISAYIYMAFILIFSVYNCYSFYNYITLTINK